MKLREYLYCVPMIERKELTLDLKEHPELLIGNGYFLLDGKEVNYQLLEKTKIILDGWKLLDIIGDIDIKYLPMFLEALLRDNSEIYGLNFTNLTGVDIYMLNTDTNEYDFIPTDVKFNKKTSKMFIKNIEGVNFYDTVIDNYEHLEQLEKGHFYIVNREIKRLFEDRLDIVVPIIEDLGIDKNSDVNKHYVSGVTY